MEVAAHVHTGVDRVEDRGEERGASRVVHPRPAAARAAQTIYDVADARIAVAAPVLQLPVVLPPSAGMMERGGSSTVEFVVQDLPSTASGDAPVLDALPVRAGIEGIIVMGAPLGRRTGSLIGRHLVDRGHRTVAFVHEEQRQCRLAPA